MSPRPPLPPFTPETASQKARLAEDAWNSRDPQSVALAYTEDSRWRNRVEFIEDGPRSSLSSSANGRVSSTIVSSRKRRRIASINDLPIAETDRKFQWPLGRRSDDHPGLSELGL